MLLWVCIADPIPMRAVVVDVAVMIVVGVVVVVEVVSTVVGVTVSPCIGAGGGDCGSGAVSHLSDGGSFVIV